MDLDVLEFCFWWTVFERLVSEADYILSGMCMDQRRRGKEFLYGKKWSISGKRKTGQ